jgi:hypothetical protein
MKQSVTIVSLARDLFLQNFHRATRRQITEDRAVHYECVLKQFFTAGSISHKLTRGTPLGSLAANCKPCPQPVDSKLHDFHGYIYKFPRLRLEYAASISLKRSCNVGSSHCLQFDRLDPQIKLNPEDYTRHKSNAHYVGMLINLWLFLFTALSIESFLDGLKKLEQRSHKCVELRGEYVE